MTTTPTKNESLPELPSTTNVGENHQCTIWAYTSAQMREYGQKCYEAALTREAPTEGVSPGDAVFAFSAMLTSLPHVVPLGAAAWATPGAYLAAAFNEANGLTVSRDFPQGLRFPEITGKLLEMVKRASEEATPPAPQRMAQEEPVAEVRKGSIENFVFCPDPNSLPVGTKLYTQPPHQDRGEVDGHDLARHLFDTALRARGLHHEAYHVGCGAELDACDQAAIDAINAALSANTRGFAVQAEPGAVRALVMAANAVLALHPEDDGMWTLELAVRPFNATKPAECANGCPANTVCDYCQIAALTEAKQQGPGEGMALVPKHYAENVGYAAVMLETSTSLIDRHNAPALRALLGILTGKGAPQVEAKRQTGEGE